MTKIACWLCHEDTISRDVQLRSNKESAIQYCESCDFEFFLHDNQSLLSNNQLDKTRLESAGLDIPAQEKDFNNGHKQSKDYIKDYIFKEDKGSPILEIGCSWGYFLQSLKEFGCAPYGVEINPVRSNFVQSKLEIPCVTTIDDIISKEDKFKKIFSFYCLEYIKYPIDYFKKLLDLLQKDGEIIFITPNLHDTLKDVWKNVAYQKFFYDECAVGYYSVKSLNVLMEALKEHSPNLRGSIKTKQGYSIYNHLYWEFNQKPINNNTLVGGDDLPSIVDSVINKNREIGKSISKMLSDFSIQYKNLLEKHDYGNQIIMRIQK